MPAETKAPRTEATRRASLPHNLKIPAITITPSSPSPDPNHPDYPEFFQDRFYLETLNKCGGSDEKPASPGSKIDISNRATEQEQARQKMAEITPEPGSSSVEICFEGVNERSRLQTVTPEVVELSSDCEREEDEHMQSTPELDVILSGALTDVERKNCLNYAEGIERRKRKTRTLDEGE